ncbi:MAG TPA: NifB/NifX family molybdenum-iron cluster-binding protein, partial [Polyangiaceae bacterium]|nr:NifB/NifX family molybdenum-iron cluster-binding protein [Polyangiaceae bacterium]
MQIRSLSLIDGRERSATGPRLRVAVATQDLKSVNAHFGSARKFAVYEVTPDGSRFVQAFDFESTSDESGEHKTEVDKISPKVSALAGCNLLFCLAIGGPVAAKVISA